MPHVDMSVIYASHHCRRRHPILSIIEQNVLDYQRPSLAFLSHEIIQAFI